MNDQNSTRFRIVGATPLLMHSTAGMDPTSASAKAIAAETSKPAKEKKLAENIEALQRAEWGAALYWTKETGPCISGDMFFACMRDAAKQQKLGAEVKRSVMVDEIVSPLEYTGPRDKPSMWKSQQFTDVRPVVVNGKKVMRCRPVFQTWAVEFTVIHDPEFLSRETLVEIVRTAGRRVGLGDYRPRFGRFAIESIDGEVVK